MTKKPTGGLIKGEKKKRVGENCKKKIPGGFWVGVIFQKIGWWVGGAFFLMG